MTTPVAIDARARAAWPWLPPAAPPRAWLQGPDGTTVRVLDDGTVAPWSTTLPQHRGAAADPCNHSPEAKE